MTAPLAITIVQGAFLPVPAVLGGAVEKAWHALGKEFARRGHRVVHVSCTHPDLPPTNLEDGVRHVRVRGYPTPRALWRLKLMDLAYTLRARRVLPPADVLVTNTFWLPLVERRRSRGRPYVHVARYPKGQLRLYPRRAVLQTVSAPIRDAILREVPAAAARVRVVPYPLSPVYLGPRGSGGPAILYAGRIHPEKGVHLLVESFAKIASTPPFAGWTLRIVGPWQTAQGGGGSSYRDRLISLAAPAQSRIELIGPEFNEAALVTRYRQAAVFAYPSLAEFGETFGLAALEAMAAGCAPLVSSLACFRDFIRPGENGMVFDHRTADPVAPLGQALTQLASDGGLRTRLQQAAWTTARDYALPEIAERFVRDFYRIGERSERDRSQGESCLPHPT